MKLVIKEQEVELRFSYSLLRVLSEKWQIRSLDVLLSKIMEACVKADEDLFSSIDLMAEMIVEAAALNGYEVDVKDAGDFLFNDPGNIVKVIQEFMASMPKPKEGAVSKKKNPAK